MKLRKVGVVALLVLGGVACGAGATVIVPNEGSTIRHTHVKFRWEPFPFSFGQGGAAAYQLHLVEDNGAEDPFQGNPTVLFLNNVSPDEPRTMVTAGLEWGKEYAWRVRAFEYDPFEWGPTHRFSTDELPEWMPALTVTAPEGGDPLQPGVTFLSPFSQTGAIPNGQSLWLAVDEAGEIIWWVLLPSRGFGPDLRLLDNGRLDVVGPANQASEITLHGGSAWQSPTPILDGDPIDHQNRSHHELFEMPNGNKLMVYFEFQEVLRDAEMQVWRGDKLVEIDPASNEIVWEWNTFDHLSPLDFDETTMLVPDNEGTYRWTWINSVIYNELDNSVYISCRHLSRIVRIDYATGDIVYQMGMTKPSGDVDFGDNFFSFQHAPEMLPNGNMLVYDNGNRRDGIDQTNETGSTKAVEIAFTGNPPTDASIVWEYTLPEYNFFVGDVDRQPNGNTLITGGGGVSQTMVLEVDAAAAELWRLTFDAGPPAWRVYRAEREATLIRDTPGDTDEDWDIDSLDYGRFQACFTGPGPAGLSFPCTLSDVDDDDDVDNDDLIVLVETTTGPL